MRKLKKFGVALLSGACILSLAAGVAACGDSGNNETPTVVEPGTSSTLITNKSPDQLTPENAIFAFLQKQSELQSYKITAEGTAVASLAGYEQDIHNVTYKNGDEYLNQAYSDSVLVKMKHQSFSKNGKVAYRNSFDGEMKVAEKTDYVKVYGFTADDILLGGYIINAKTLRYATLAETEGDTFTYYMRLAGDQSVASGAATESATASIRLQTKAYGSLENLPSFSDVDLRLTIKKDWTPVSFSSSCSYEAKKIFNMSVEQSVTSTYSDINGTVMIPSAEEFNSKLGMQPSEVVPETGEADPLMQLATAVGGAFDEQDTLAVSAPISVALGAQNVEIPGELELKLRKDALGGDAIADAFAFRYDLDLSALPLVSGIANTLTLRYLGDGLLFVMLNNRAEQDNYVFTYTADLGNLFADQAGETFSLERLQTTIEQTVDVEKTDTGFAISPKPSALQGLNSRYGEMIASLAETLGDTHGYLQSLLGFTFTELKLELAGTDTVTGISVSVAATPGENVTMGEKIGVSLDIKLFGGAFNRPFTGDLDFRLDPTVVWSGDYFALAKAHLNLDLTPAAQLLRMFGMFGSSIPDIPSWLSADLNSLDVYYMGDGMLTLVLNNAEKNPVFTTDIDLTQYFLPAATALDGETSGETSGTQGLQLPQLIFEVKENGFEISLGETLVQALDAAYGELVQTAVDSITEAAGGGLMGGIAGQMINGWIGATITGAGIFLGTNDEGQAMFCLTITGCPTSNPSGDYSERALLTLTLTHLGELSADEKKSLLDAGEEVKELHEMSEKAAEYDAQLQKFIDEMDVTEGGYTQYVADVTALQNKIASEKDGVKTLMSNRSYLAETTYGEKQYSLLLLTAELYHERAEAFKSTVAEITADSEETAWDELNALYDKNATVQGIAVPAIKESEILKTAVGDDTIQTYLEKRNTHETQVAEDLAEKIATAKTAFNAEENQNRDGWTAALTKIVNEFKPVYDKLSAALQEGTGYRDFVAAVYQKNLDDVIDSYKEIKSELEALTEKGNEASIDDLLGTMKKLSSAYALYYGSDYWKSNSDNTTTAMAWGKTWVTALKPTWLEETAQTALNQKVTDLIALNRELIKGTVETALGTALKEVIGNAVSELYEEIGACRIVAEESGAVTWDFSKFDAASEETKAALLEKIHGLRFLISKVLPTTIINDIWGNDPKDEMRQFARTNLTKYEAEFEAYVAASSAPQA